MESTRFADAIAYGGWHVDTHPPAGVDAIDESPCTQHRVPHLYDIPLRSCVSGNLKNLMFAGRNLSATHLAFASTRVMATCAAVGQGVGTAAAFAVQAGIDPCDLAANEKAMQAIQQQLLHDDAYLIGLRNESPQDHACQARIAASSSQPGGEPENVISGQTRAVYGERGAPPERAFAGSHRWMSDPGPPLPQWLKLHWPAPISAARVQLIFDTGMHRPLTFSLADAYTALMQWGQPQVETVRDYSVELLVDGGWRTAATIRGNYQRRRVHELPDQPFTALRIMVSATNGLDHARVCEVRVEGSHGPSETSGVHC
jgi:hypothetical protein